MEARVSSLRQTYAAASQSHVFRFFETLSEPQKEGFLKQLEGIDVKRVIDTYRQTINASGPAAPSRVDPLPKVVKYKAADESQREAWRKAGMELASQGKVAFLLLAGGQGTRLGTSDPKGCYDIGLPSHKSLFQLMAERLRRLKTLSGAGAAIPWYVMTSPMTDAATQEFFTKHAFFGLQEERPSLEIDSAIKAARVRLVAPVGARHGDEAVLCRRTSISSSKARCRASRSTASYFSRQAPGRVATAPDGNGGIYRALFESGALADMQRHGVECVHASSVDNALVLPADPAFVGYCRAEGADCGAKVCAKAAPDEAVGVLCAAPEGGARVVEYSEIDAEAARETDPATGELRLNAGNICNHYYTLDFLNMAATLPTPYHIAKKKIPTVDENVERAEEFGPVKNAPGAAVDSPDSARALLLALGRRYLEEAGVPVEGEGGVEVSPLLSYRGEGLVSLAGQGVTARAGFEVRLE